MPDLRRGAGRLARVSLPERGSSGTHATWAAGRAIPGWGDAESAPASLGL